jgi:hypothetical protein
MSSARTPAALVYEEGLELFHRAVVLRDEHAWACLYQQYAPLVLTWVTQHPSAAQLVAEEGAPSLVNGAFARFAEALSPAKMEQFASLSALLKYLKLCAHSEVADEVRARRVRQYEEPFLGSGSEPATQDDVSSMLVLRLVHQGLWRMVEDELHGEDERIQVRLGFIYGLKPREITARYPQLFPKGAQDVTRVRSNVLSRLRRSQRLRHYLVQHGYLTRQNCQGKVEEADTLECEAPGAGTSLDRRPCPAGEQRCASASVSKRRAACSKNGL